MRPRLFPIPVLLLALVGCAPGNPGLFIGNVVAPNEQCEYSESNPFIAQGFLDTSVPGAAYFAVITLNNQLISLAQTGMSGYPPMADPNVINVHSLELEYRDVGGNALALSANPVTVPVGGVAVPTGDGMTAGISLGGVFLIPPGLTGEIGALAGSLGGSIVVSVTAIGQTLGGAEVVSNEFTFPITICSGCLLACVTDMDGMALCAPACIPGQDSLHLACDASCIAGAG